MKYLTKDCCLRTRLWCVQYWGLTQVNHRVKLRPLLALKIEEVFTLTSIKPGYSLPGGTFQGLSDLQQQLFSLLFFLPV